MHKESFFEPENLIGTSYLSWWAVNQLGKFFYIKLLTVVRWKKLMLSTVNVLRFKKIINAFKVKNSDFQKIMLWKVNAPSFLKSNAWVVCWGNFTEYRKVPFLTKLSDFAVNSLRTPVVLSQLSSSGHRGHSCSGHRGLSCPGCLSCCLVAALLSPALLSPLSLTLLPCSDHPVLSVVSRIPFSTVMSRRSCTPGCPECKLTILTFWPLTLSKVTISNFREVQEVNTFKRWRFQPNTFSSEWRLK